MPRFARTSLARVSSPLLPRFSLVSEARSARSSIPTVFAARRSCYLASPFACFVPISLVLVPTVALRAVRVPRCVPATWTFSSSVGVLSLRRRSTTTTTTAFPFVVFPLVVSPHHHRRRSRESLLPRAPHFAKSTAHNMTTSSSKRTRLSPRVVERRLVVLLVFCGGGLSRSSTFLLLPCVGVNLRRPIPFAMMMMAVYYSYQSVFYVFYSRRVRAARLVVVFFASSSESPSSSCWSSSFKVKRSSMGYRVSNDDDDVELK